MKNNKPLIDPTTEYKGIATSIDHRYKMKQTHWRKPVVDLVDWMQKRESFLRDIYHFTEFRRVLSIDGTVIMDCFRPQHKNPETGRILRHKEVSFQFTPITK